MLTPSDVIDRARDLHPSFTRGNHPPKVLVRELSAWQRELLSKVQRVYPEELRLLEEIALPVDPFGDGHTMPSNTGVEEGTLYHNETEFPRTRFEILPEVQHVGRAYWPSGFVRGGTLFLNGRESDWTGYDRLEVPYIPAPTEIDLETDTSTLPDAAMAAARFHLAEFMAVRHDGSEPAPDPRYFATRAEGKEEEFLDAMQLRGSGVEGKVRDVRGM